MRDYGGLAFRVHVKGDFGVRWWECRIMGGLAFCES